MVKHITKEKIDERINSAGLFTKFSTKAPSTKFVITERFSGSGCDGHTKFIVINLKDYDTEDSFVTDIENRIIMLVCDSLEGREAMQSFRFGIYIWINLPTCMIDVDGIDDKGEKCTWFEQFRNYVSVSFLERLAKHIEDKYSTETEIVDDLFGSILIKDVFQGVN